MDLVFQTLSYSLLFIILTEIGDKTMLTALCFSARQNPLAVLISTLSALFVSTMIGIIVGMTLSVALPFELSKYIAVILFLLIGLSSFLGPVEHNLDCSDETGLFSIFVLVIVSELGDKSQLTILAMAAYSTLPIVTLAGAMLGFVIVNSMGVFIGHKFASRISANIIRRVTGVIFILFGFLVFFGIF